MRVNIASDANYVSGAEDFLTLIAQLRTLKMQQKSKPTGQNIPRDGPPLGSVPPSNVKQRTLGQSWLALPRKTRLILSCCFTGSALIGLYISNQLEEKLPVDKSTTQAKPASKQ